MTCLHNHDQILEFLRKIFLKGFQIYQNYLCALSVMFVTLTVSCPWSYIFTHRHKLQCPLLLITSVLIPKVGSHEVFKIKSWFIEPQNSQILSVFHNTSKTQVHLLSCPWLQQKANYSFAAIYPRVQMVGKKSKKKKYKKKKKMVLWCV